MTNPAQLALYLVTPSLQTEFAPSGALRIAINLGNAVLAGKDPATGAPRGVSVDLARELAKRLDLKYDLIPFDAAGKVVNAVKERQVDIAFVAIDPLRAQDIAYSAAYVIIEGAYLVRQDSPLRTNEQVDKPGIRMVVAANSAYDLYLSREIKAAQLVKVVTSQQVVDKFLSDGLEVAAGVKQQLELDAARLGGLRLLPGRFMAINQAMGVPADRRMAREWLGRFVEVMKAEGFVAQSLLKHGVQGAAVAPLL